MRYTIDEYCEKKNISLSELARRLGIRQSTLSDARKTKSPHFINSSKKGIELIQVKVGY